jgi:hypothetical protein
MNEPVNWDRPLVKQGWHLPIPVCKTGDYTGPHTGHLLTNFIDRQDLETHGNHPNHKNHCQDGHKRRQSSRVNSA